MSLIKILVSLYCSYTVIQLNLLRFELLVSAVLFIIMRLLTDVFHIIQSFCSWSVDSYYCSTVDCCIYSLESQWWSIGNHEASVSHLHVERRICSHFLPERVKNIPGYTHFQSNSKPILHFHCMFISTQYIQFQDKLWISETIKTMSAVTQYDCPI